LLTSALPLIYILCPFLKFYFETGFLLCTPTCPQTCDSPASVFQVLGITSIHHPNLGS
jgi:hypothetical protein